MERNGTTSDDATVTDDPPERYGWLVVIGALFVQITSMGVNTSWGVMQNYYEQHVFIDLPNAVIQLSFVGTLALSFMRLMGPVAQLMEPWIGHKGVLVIGCLCKAIGMLMAGFATQVYQLYLFQGLLFGCGSSLMYYTSLTLTPQWFTKRKGLALGIVASGSGIGGLVVPFIMTSINSRLGPSWTYRILGFICLAMDLSACILIKQNPTFQSEKKKKKLSDIIQLNVLRDIDYVLWVIGSDIVLLGYFIPFYFLPSYGHYVGLTDAQGAVLVSISSAFNFVGRATTGYCADYLGQLNTNILFTLVGGLSCLLIWTFAYNFGALIGFSIVFGLFCGAYFSLLSPITMLILGKDRFPTGLSLLLIFNIIGVFGPNIASAIETSLLRSVGPAYQPFLSYKLFAGICYLVGVLVFVFLRFRINKNWRTLL